MATIVIASVVATKWDNGGNAAAVLNWVQGFKKLGLRTYFLEQIEEAQCTDEAGAPAPFEHSVNALYFEQVMRDAGLEATSALVCNDGAQTRGLSYGEVLDIADGADLLLNITGHLTSAALLRRFRRKAYLDLDPGYTQFWFASGQTGARLEGHDFHFTIGENIGTSECAIPTSGVHWRHTRQPIVVSDTDTCASGGWNDRFTTVSSWRGPYGSVQYGATTFGLKVHEFRKFIDLPLRADSTFEVALDIDPADEQDLKSLHRHGWTVVNPRHVVRKPQAFDDYIHNSDAEWSVAQGIYVSTHSGWFSDRTVRYLAAGKPAVVQDTGFSRTFPVGDGLLAFRTLDQAVEAVRAIGRDPIAHQQAARDIAVTFFDSDQVLGRLLDEIGVAA